LDYNPSENTTKPEGAGEWFDPTPGRFNDPGYPETQLYGTGPLMFEYYDPVGLNSSLHANRQYFLTTDEMQALNTLLTKMASNSSENANKVAGLAVAPPVGLEPTTSGDITRFPSKLPFFPMRALSFTSLSLQLGGRSLSADLL